MIKSLLTATFHLGLFLVVMAQEDHAKLRDTLGDLALFDRQELLDAQSNSQKPYLNFFNNDHMMMGDLHPQGWIEG